MAKLTIADVKTPIKYSQTPNYGSLALPLSLATEQGKGIKSITDAISVIQKDLHQIEDEKQLNEILPDIVIDIQKEYETLSRSSDLTNGPKKLEKVLSVNNYLDKLKDKNKNVKTLLTQELNKQRIKLLPGLVTSITTRTVEEATLGIDSKINNAFQMILSGDAALIGFGDAEWQSIKNNKNYQALLGEKKWKEYTDKKELQLSELQLDIPLRLKPNLILENVDALVEAVGTEKAQEIVEKAEVNLISKTTSDKNQNILAELADNETKVHAFTEALLRINNTKHKKGFADLIAEGEIPSIADLHDGYELGLYNKAMYNILINAVRGEEQLSDPEIHELVTVALYSADSIERMDDIKNAVLLDETILRKLGLTDLTQFTALVDNAKKDFPAFQAKKSYGKLLDANLKNLTNIRSGKQLKYAQNLESRKVIIKQAYNQKILDGMSPKNAYLDTLVNEMGIDGIPNIRTALPGFLRDINLKEAISKSPDTFWEQQHQTAFELFNGYTDDKGIKIKGHGSIKKFKHDLAQLDFMHEIFQVRMAVAPGTLAQKLEFATTEGQSIDLKELFDLD